MNEKSTLWTTLESNPPYNKSLLKALERYQNLSAPEIHDGVTMLELAVGRCTDVKIIKYMTENKFWHNDGEPFDFGVAANAILNPNEKILEYLISQGLDLIEDKESGCGPLHIASADNKNPKVIKAIIANGADVNLRELETGVTPFLMAASKNTNPDVLKILKQAGADVFAKTNDGKTALHLAAQDGLNPEIIDTLVNFGLNVNEEDNSGCTPFMYAVTRDDISFFKTLISHGAHILTKDKMGQTPLFYAAYMNPNPYIVKAMINIGFPINEKNKEGRTPLMYSSLNCNDDIAKILIENGADVNIEDSNGKKAFCYILEQTKSLKVVKLMAELSNFANDEHIRWLFLAAASGYNDLKIIKQIIKLGADIKLKNKDNRSVLHFAVIGNKKPEIIKFLIKNGLDVNAFDDIKATPFLYAARGNESPEILKTLLEFGADPLVRHNDNRSALHIACEQNPSEAVVEFLLNLGLFDINEKDSLGFSPFLYSTANPNPNIMKLLVSHGADTKVTDVEGSNALVIAGSNAKDPEIIDFLIDTLHFPVNSTGKSGYDSIYYAAFNNFSVEIIDCLVRHGAKLDKFYQNGLNLLMVASRFNINPNIVTYLVERGIDIDLRSKEPEFEEEEDEVKSEIFKELEEEAQEESKNKKISIKEKYKDTYKAGTTAIMHAACNLNVEVLEALIACGANIHDHDKIGKDLLNYAAGSNENPIVPKYLISKFGFRANRKDENQTTAVFDAVMNPNLDTLKSILEYGGNLETVALGGVTPLMVAAMVNPNPEVIKYLLEEGMSVYDVDDSGMTPLLHAAATNDNAEICEILIAAGANIFVENVSGLNALALARENKNPFVYQTILKHASMNITTVGDPDQALVN